MKVQKAKISDLKPDSRNANKHTARGSEMVSGSLKKLGAGRSILLDKNNRIIAGNLTTEQAGELGMDDVIIVESDGSKIIAVKRTDLDLEKDKKAKELAIADNRSAEVSLNWDQDVLSELKEEIEIGEYFNADELFDLIGGDAEPEVKGKIAFSNEIDQESNYVVLKFDKKIDFLQIQTLLGLESTYSRRANGKPWSKGIGRVVDGVDAIAKIGESFKSF